MMAGSKRDVDFAGRSWPGSENIIKPVSLQNFNDNSFTRESTIDPTESGRFREHFQVLACHIRVTY
jgi:hypothetical protein